MNYLDPIIITGCARSFTSLVAGIIARCGAYSGITCGATAHNEKGQYENLAIRNGLVKPFLKAMHCDPMGQFPLPETDDIEIDPSWRLQVLSIMSMQGLKSNQVWFHKEAKACLIWPQWNTAFPGAKWIITRRHDENIIQSCMKTPFMRAFKKPEGWQWWIDQHKKKFVEMNEAGLQMREVWPFKMIEHQDYTSMKEVVGWCGLKWNEKKIREFVTPNLCHHKQNSGRAESISV